MSEINLSTHSEQLVHLVDQIVRESGDPTGFDAAGWVAEFLDARITALGGRRPRELMQTSEGRATVVQFLRQIQSGTCL